MMVRRCGIGWLAFMAASSFALGEDAVRLRYRFDEKSAYRREQRMTQQQTVSGRSLETKVTQSDVTVLTPEKSSGKRMRLRCETREFQVAMDSGPLGSYRFDSSAPGTGGAERHSSGALARLNDHYARLGEATVVVELTAAGRLSTSKADGKRDQPREKGTREDESRREIQEAIIARLTELLPRLPEKKVETGDTWDADVELTLPRMGMMRGRERYTFDGFEDVAGRRLAKISVTHDAAIDVELEAEGARVVGRLIVEDSSGTAYFDAKNGRLVSAAGDYSLAGTLTITAAGQTFEAPTLQTFTTTVERLHELPD